MTPPEVIEPYPDEMPKLADAYHRLQREFEFTPMDSINQRIFEMAAHNIIGEAGFLIDIQWSEILDNGAPTGIYSPILQITGRNRKETETDHERMRYGIVRGLDGGEPGYVREDGTVTEDPIKRNIL